MLPTYCPQCRSIRQPNGQFCHSCGYSYVERRAAEPGAIPLQIGSRLSIGDGFRFGIGFMTAVVVFWIVFSLLLLIGLSGILSALLRGIPR